MNLQDNLYKYVNEIDLSSEEKEQIQKFIDSIVKNYEPLYKYLEMLQNDKEKSNKLLSAIRKVIKEK